MIISFFVDIFLAPILASRFPDQTVINVDDYQYFASKLDLDEIFTGGDIVVGAK